MAQQIPTLEAADGITLTDEDKQTWEDLSNIYIALANSIVDLGGSINLAIQAVVGIEGLSIPPELNLIIKTVSSDLNSFSKQLVSIKKQHEDRSGIVETDDDLALCLSLFQDYVSLQERMTAVTFNPMLEISEMLMTITGDAKEHARETENTEAI
jgi:hypothetical protein